MLPKLGEIPDTSMYPPISSISDEDVILLADLTMDSVQDERFSYLQAKGKSSGLTPDERNELSTLMGIYQIGLLRKSEGLVEAVRRGLREPLKS